MPTRRPPTTFDLPQFPLHLDKEWRKYATVDNMAHLYDGDVLVETFFIAVPTELFTLMRDALHVTRNLEVSLYFLVHGSHVLFGVTDGVNEWDLWAYAQGSLPKFLEPHVTLEE